jgi:hypothetical protein
MYIYVSAFKKIAMFGFEPLLPEFMLTKSVVEPLGVSLLS